MSGRSSRLHTLERGLKAPRKSRAKARALTVMRLESGTTPARPNTRPARLPRDMEDQIAIVRGRAIGKPSRGLLQLEERLLRPGAVGPTTPLVQRHDHGAIPPSPSGPPSAAPPAPQTPSAPQAHALATPMAFSQFGGENYNVESFEDTSLPSPVMNIAAAVNTAPATISPCTGPPVATVSKAAPPAMDRTAVTRRNALTPDQEAAAADFERDIAAMLGTSNAPCTPENQQWDKAVHDATEAPAVPPPAAAVTTAERTATPKRLGHEVFDQMGVAMNYANSFDLGAMELSARFDRFDKELALSAKPARPAPASSASTAFSSPSSVQAIALDDFDLIADLTEISDAQSAPAPTATVAKGEPCVTKEEAPPATPTPSPAPAPTPSQPHSDETSPEMP